MCIVCVEYAKGTLTIKEAKRALFELIGDEKLELEHIFDTYDLLKEDEKEENEPKSR